MRKMTMAAASAAALLLVGSNTVLAQDDEESGDARIVPVETYTCNFHEGKGSADLMKVVAEWNAFMDKEDANDYFAALLYPNFASNSAFDVGWIGGWMDGRAMGAGTDLWVAKGSELGAKFNAVCDWDSHTLFAAMQMRKPPDNDDDDKSFVMAFSNCSLEGDTEFEDVQAAQEKWNAYADENGFVNGSWVMWPVWGENVEADYDFKVASTTDDYATLGGNFQLMAEGHWQKSQEIWSGLLDCDSSRVYTAVVIREMEDD